MASDLAMVLGLTGVRTSVSFFTMVTIGPPAARRPPVGPGPPPAELLQDLVAVGLGTFRVVRPNVDVDEGPAVLVRDLGAEAVDLVVGPLHRHQRRLVHERRDDLALLEIRRDEDIAL